jgi:hypothetical protein
MSETPDPEIIVDRSRPIWARDGWTHLALTMPIFVLYHLGVAFLPMRNAADVVTTELKSLAEQNAGAYAALTLMIGGSIAAILYLFGRGGTLSAWRFALVGGEGILYGLAMRAAGAYALEALPLGGPSDATDGTFTAVVMALGAGFYEEIAFRVVLFGVGAWITKVMLGRGPIGLTVLLGWAVACAAAFSAWHHLGPGAESWDMRVFVYRATCGLVLSTIYWLRGFAPAVWTHALYDVWALV